MSRLALMSDPGAKVCLVLPDAHFMLKRLCITLVILPKISFYHRHSTVFTKEKKRKSADEERKEKERRKEK